LSRNSLLFFLILVFLAAFGSCLNDLPVHAEYSGSNTQIANILSSAPEQDQLPGDPVMDYRAHQFYLNTTITINVVFVGFEANASVITTVNDSLTHWYAPIVTSPGYYLGANYTLDIAYLNAPLQLASDYFTYVDDNIGIRLAPSFLVNYDPSMSGYNVGVMDAELAETWLWENAESYTGLENLFNASYTLFILDSWTSGDINYYYYYNTSVTDPDTELDFSEDFMISWGGNSRFYFIDWSAGPTSSQEGYPFGEPVNATTVKPIWDYANEAELCDAIAEFVDESIGLLFTPSYLYHPTYSEEYALQYLVVDATSDDSVFNSAAAYINTQVVEEAFTKLIPYANWTTNFTVANVDAFPALNAKVKAYPDGSGGYTHLNSSLFTPEFVDGLFGSVPGAPIYVRALMVVYDDLTYLDSVGALGRGLDWGALMVGYKAMLANQGSGFTGLAIHENGHVFGLRHPHDGYDDPDHYASDDPSLADWLYDFQATPMSYLIPALGHGAGGSTFSWFNYDTLDRGHVLDLLNRTQFVLQEMALTLENVGYATLPADVQAVVNETNANWTLCLTEFAKMDYYNQTEGADDAFLYAFQAWVSAKEAIVAAEAALLSGPTIDSPSDVTYEEGTINHTITWTPMDDGNPANYTVHRDGVVFARGTWNGSTITISIDGIAVGSRTYNLTVYDGAGNFASDAVQVTVIAPPESLTSSTAAKEDNEKATAPGFTMGVLLVVGAVLLITRRFHKRRSR
jgi:hypothetical protein